MRRQLRHATVTPTRPVFEPIGLGKNKIKQKIPKRYIYVYIYIIFFFYKPKSLLVKTKPPHGVFVKGE